MARQTIAKTEATEPAFQVSTDEVHGSTELQRINGTMSVCLRNIQLYQQEPLYECTIEQASDSRKSAQITSNSAP